MVKEWKIKMHIKKIFIVKLIKKEIYTDWKQF